MAAKPQDIAGKGSSIRPAALGKAQFNLAYSVAADAFNPLNGQFYKYRHPTNRNGSKSAHDVSSSLYVARFALGTPEGEIVLFNTKDDGTVFKKSPNIMVTVNTESVIQQACGHPICLSVSGFRQPFERHGCLLFSTPSTQIPDEPIL
jgi:hypothetical protein